MSKNYDNWERLVTAVLRREWDREIALCHSMDLSSIGSRTSSSAFDLSFSSISHFDEDQPLILPQRSRLPYQSVSGKMMRRPDKQEVGWTSASMSFSLEKRSGKKCYMVGARKLTISWGDTPRYWEWTSHADSRFSKVAQLKCIFWLDIQCKIKTQMLSSQTSYGAYLVFKLAADEGLYGLESADASVVIFVNDKAAGDAEERADIVPLQSPENGDSHQQQIGRRPVKRVDGWMEIELGNFYNDQGEEQVAQARLKEITTNQLKCGLIVEGIEFRPTHTLTPFVLKKKQVQERNTIGGGAFSNFRFFR